MESTMANDLTTVATPSALGDSSIRVPGTKDKLISISADVAKAIGRTRKCERDSEGNSRATTRRLPQLLAPRWAAGFGLRHRGWPATCSRRSVRTADTSGWTRWDHNFDAGL